MIGVLTVAYCRVSTEEQATEGFSIDGQAEKLRAYASLNDLGEVTVISDPGRSGKDMERAGLQQLLAMVEAGHVSHLLLWRLERLPRHLGDPDEVGASFGRQGHAAGRAATAPRHGRGGPRLARALVAPRSPLAQPRSPDRVGGQLRASR